MDMERITNHALALQRQCQSLTANIDRVTERATQSTTIAPPATEDSSTVVVDRRAEAGAVWDRVVAENRRYNATPQDERSDSAPAVTSHPNTSTRITDDTDLCEDLVRMLREKLQRMRCEHQVHQQHVPSASRDPDAVRAAVFEEVERDTQQMERLLRSLQEQLVEEDALLAHEQRVVKDHNEFHDAMDRKIDQARKGDTSKRSDAAQLKKQIASYASKTNRLISVLRKFLNTHYPANPMEDGNDGEHQKKKRRLGDSLVGDVGERQGSAMLLPLQDLLQKLMNGAIQMTERESFIDTSDNASWAPHVELLVRSGICVRHETNTNLLRLTRFHV